MSYFPKKDYLYSYNHESIAFDVGKESKDSYCITTQIKHHVESGITTSEISVVKNWVYEELPKDESKIKLNKKYRETLFTGSAKECLKFIDNIVQSEGYWDQHPTNAFEKVFIEPTI